MYFNNFKKWLDVYEELLFSKTFKQIIMEKLINIKYNCVKIFSEFTQIEELL